VFIDRKYLLVGLLVEVKGEFVKVLLEERRRGGGFGWKAAGFCCGKG